MDSRSHWLDTFGLEQKSPSGSLTFTLCHLSCGKSIIAWLISIRKREMTCRLSTESHGDLGPASYLS